MNTAPASASYGVRLLFRGREVALSAGTHVLGRDKSCALQLGSALASRRHARVDVSRSGGLIEDLGSANGVYVNGERIGERPVRLRTGDRLVLGDDELEVLAESHPISKAQLIGRAPYEESDVDPEPSSPGTRKGDFFQLVEKIVDRALQEGRAGDAATMLRSQLAKILASARAGRVPEPGVRDGALKYSLALARADRGGEWLDYALDLLTATRFAPDAALARQIESTLSAASSVDDARLARYVSVLEASVDAAESPRVLLWARGLGRSLRRKSRPG